MITIVTAFFDIGRGNWQSYARSVDRYFENFSRMCLLENSIVLFSESAHKDRVSKLQAQKSNLYVFYLDNLFEQHSELLAAIARIQKNPNFRIDIKDPDCPEYNEPKYILINYLKSYFCLEATKRQNIVEGAVAWIDFGYLRKNRQLPVSLRWDYPFEDKIHLFSLLPLSEAEDLYNTVKNGTVFIQGCHMVASPQKWQIMERLVSNALLELMSRDLVDDDQTLLLMAARSSPQDFVIRPANIYTKLGWFFIFRKFNIFELKPSLKEHLAFFIKTLFVH